MSLTDIIGLMGVACVLSGYFLLQIEKVKSDPSIVHSSTKKMKK